MRQLRQTLRLHLEAHLTVLAGCDCVCHARTILVTGATGIGKTWLSCALARQPEGQAEEDGR